MFELIVVSVGIVSIVIICGAVVAGIALLLGTAIFKLLEWDR